jgi:phenylacetate-CoA ligase
MGCSMIRPLLSRIIDHVHSSAIRKDGRWTEYALFRKAQWNASKENTHIQRDRLYAMVHYAINKIPYYRQIAKNRRIRIHKSTIFNDIKKFPILTKEIIRDHYEELYVIKQDRECYLNTSGGSTGEPVTFYQDKYYSGSSRAMKRLHMEWAGLRHGEPLIIIWGAPHDVKSQTMGFRKMATTWLNSITILDAYYMDEKIMRSYVTIINRIKPKVILGYAQSLTLFAQFIETHKIKVHSPVSVMSAASTLHPEMRETIERAFNCKVFNRYGSREVGDMACECERHEGLHVSSFTHYLEILDNDLKPCKNDELGTIVVTSLTNYTMPLIRYEIGDMAITTSRKCSCGRGLPLVKEIVGRDNDLFVNKEGKKIHTASINTLFYFKEFIHHYQVIQKSVDHLVVKIVLSSKSAKYDIPAELDSLREAIGNVMGNPRKVEITICKTINPSRTGKYRFTIREFPLNQQ